MSEQPLIKAGESKVISLADETQYAPQGIVSRTVLSAGGVRVVLFGFDAGQELSEHTSTRNVMAQIISGECEFTVRDTAHKLKAGDVLYMPPEEPHIVRAVSRFSMLLTLGGTSAS